MKKKLQDEGHVVACEKSDTHRFLVYGEAIFSKQKIKYRYILNSSVTRV
jgi:hypothetical protein